MELLQNKLYEEIVNNQHTLGILLLDKEFLSEPVTGHYDQLLIVVVDNIDDGIHTKHYICYGKSVAMHLISSKQIKNRITSGSTRSVIHWLIYGKILFERNDFLSTYKRMLDEFPPHLREKKMGIEFAKFLKCYEEGKNLYELNQHLDALYQMINALHHLGRISVIELGIPPEITVWNQVRKLRPDVFQLYKELSESNETLDKRIELILIALRFAINDRTEIGGKHLIDVMNSKEEVSWTYEDLIEHPDLNVYELNLEYLLEHLVDKGFVEICSSNNVKHVMKHRNYIVRK